MLLKEIDYLVNAEREILLRKQTRMVTFLNTEPQQVDAYALVWNWYDRIVAYRHSAGEDQIKENWQACMAEENLSASDALVRLVYVYANGADRTGLDLTENGVQLQVAQQRMANWWHRKAARQCGNG